MSPAPLPAAFTALYREHYGFVWRCARRLGASDAYLDDAVQETFMIALRRLCEFDDAAPAHPPTWLFAILANVLRNHERGQRRHARKVRAVAVECEHQQVRLAPERGAMTSLARSLLDDFVDSLDEDHRAVYLLAELEGHSSREIGEALHISPNTARSRLRAARAAFDRRFDGEQRVAVIAAMRHQPKPSRQRQRSTLQAIAAAELGKLGAGAGVGGGTLSFGLGSLWAKLGLALVGVVAVAAATLVPPTSEDTPALGSAPVSARASAEHSRAAPRPPARTAKPEIEAKVELALDPIPVIVSSQPAPEPRDATTAAKQGRSRALAALADARTALIERRPSDALTALAAVSSWPDPALARRALATRVGALCGLGRAREAEAAVTAWTGPALPNELLRACW